MGRKSLKMNQEEKIIYFKMVKDRCNKKYYQEHREELIEKTKERSQRMKIKSKYQRIMPFKSWLYTFRHL